MITDIVLGGLIILAGLLMVLFAESINEFRDRGVIFYRFGRSEERRVGKEC